MLAMHDVLHEIHTEFHSSHCMHAHNYEHQDEAVDAALQSDSLAACLACNLSSKVYL
jgi:hypothetical protein